MRILRKFIEDERGSILPLIAVILILTIFIGCANFALAVMYRDRTTVRDALEAGVTSSLVAHAKEERRGLYHGEKLVEVEFEWDVPRRKWVCDSRDEEGHCTSGHYKYWTDYDVVSAKAWKNTESDFKNYIYLDKAAAESTAKSYMEENFGLNNLKDRAKIVSFSYEVTYDDKRTYTVVKNRDLNRKYQPPTKPSPNRQEYNYYGVPAIKSSKYRKSGKLFLNNPLWNEYDGETWWKVQFKGAYGADGTMDKLTIVPDWNSSIVYEEREDVFFPRWVEVQAKAKVELPIPFGGLLGRETYTAEFETTGFKELIEVIE